MKDKLTVALVQTDLVWENPVLNRSLIEKKILNEKSKIDLFILPEMFTSGFTMHPKTVAESMQGDSIIWLKKLSKIKNAAICGSLVIREKKCFYNRLVFVEPDGCISSYDKRHTFKMAGEGESYCSGSNFGLIEYNGWKILLRICYDLRFPVWSRNVDDYELLIYVANWPSPRINAWDNLIIARAIENVSYCIGVNRIGLDENKNSYPGHSLVIDSLGKKILNLKNKAGVYVTELDKNHLKKIRTFLPFLDEKDSFILE
ncbi:MAG: omega-amidase [Candidatus Marivariicella framensis]|mgnify:FL=1|jgi:omega-amidase|tara:strand:+ start:790 stop:1566 length:777 start_codon:yes stop_codon:yes gene_type:complete